jgi:hypothetical protein
MAAVQLLATPGLASAQAPAAQPRKEYLKPLKDPTTREGAGPELELSRDSGADTDPVLRVWGDYPSTRGSLGRLMGDRRDPSYRDPVGKVVALEVLRNGDVLFGPNIGIVRRPDRRGADARVETDPQHSSPIDFYWDARDRKLHVRSILLTENGDPADLAFRRSGDETYPYGPPMGVRKGMNLGTMYWMGWGADNFGFNNRAAQVYATAAEDISARGSGGTLHLATTPQGSTARPIDRIVIGSDGNVGVGTKHARAKLHVAGRASGFAEDYAAIEALEPGDVVAIDERADAMRVRRAAQAYDRAMVGVVTGSPALRVSQAREAARAEGAPDDVEDGYPVAHAGRVTVKVSTENGAIRPGDYLTSSSAPGVAMKATRKGDVMGKA